MQIFWDSIICFILVQRNRTSDALWKMHGLWVQAKEEVAKSGVRDGTAVETQMSVGPHLDELCLQDRNEMFTTGVPVYL